MKKDAIWPGQVFSTEHFDEFSRSFVKHMFVCVYVSKLDDPADRYCNITGLLITSKVGKNNSIEIDLEKHSFLDRKSFCLVNGNYTFGKNDQMKLVGQLDAATFKDIIAARNEYFRQELYQCMTSLVNMSKYQAKEEK